MSFILDYIQGFFCNGEWLGITSTCYLNLDKSIKCIYSYLGKNAKLPGYMDYLHLSTSDVGNLKESWSVLEDNVSKVKLLSKLINIIDQKTWVFAMNSDFLITLQSDVVDLWQIKYSKYQSEQIRVQG